MKIILALLALTSVLSCQLCTAQTTQPADNQPADDWKPATSNQQGKQYPQVNSEHRVRYRIVAPQAQRVRVGGTILTKDENGVWIGISQPMDEGFHYYTINIDGAEVPDPNSLYFYGAGRWGSGIEIPADDQDFYAMKNVPHGQLREVAISPRPVIRSAASTSIPRRIMTSTGSRIIRCSIYNTARAKTRPAGATKVTSDQSWTT